MNRKRLGVRPRRAVALRVQERSRGIRVDHDSKGAIVETFHGHVVADVVVGPQVLRHPWPSAATTDENRVRVRLSAFILGAVELD